MDVWPTGSGAANNSEDHTEKEDVPARRIWWDDEDGCPVLEVSDVSKKRYDERFLEDPDRDFSLRCDDSENVCEEKGV